MIKLLSITVADVAEAGGYMKFKVKTSERDPVLAIMRIGIWKGNVWYPPHKIEKITVIEERDE